MSVTPRRSWPTNEGAHSQGGGDSQRAHPSTGNIHHQSHHPHGNRAMTSAAAHANATTSSNTSAANNTLPSHMESSAQKSSSHAGQGSLKPPLPPPVMTPQQQQQQPTQQQQSLPHQQQVRPLASAASNNNLPPGSSSLFSPPSGTSLPSMADIQQQQQHLLHQQQQQQQANLFVNGQSDMNQPPGYPGAGGGSAAHNNMGHVKSENQSASGGQYDFQSRMDLPMNDFDQHQKDMMQMPGDNLFNSMAQQQQHPIHHSQSLGDIKSMGHASNVSSPAMSMPVSGGKPKSHSAAMAQVRNASSWSSLAASTPAGSSKSSNIGDSFQMFKRQAKEKEARQKALIEQQEMRRQQKEQAERERMRVEADRRREREEEEALENAR